MTQQNPAKYAEAIQAQLTSTFAPIPVHSLFNRNFAKEATFVTWQLRNVHQPVYTGTVQSVKGIDTPVFQVSIFSQTINAAFNASNTMLQSLHGYSGQFGGVGGILISKCDVGWLYHTYDDETRLNQIVLDCRLYIPT